MHRKIEMSLGYAVVVLLACFGVAIGAGYFYTNHVDRKRAAYEKSARIEADRRWCSVLTTLDSAYQSKMPTTELGRQIADAMHNLTIEFGCK